MNETRKNTGILLAGGNSSRIGQDKALISIDGLPLWQRSSNALATVCASVLIAGDRSDLATANIPCFHDTFPGSSLAGIHTGLTHSKTEWVTILPCDMPFPSTELLCRLQTACADNIDAIVPRTRLGREPLVACYHKKVLPKMTDRILSGRPRILDLLDELNVLYLDEKELPPGWRRSLYNINTQADLDKIAQPPPVLSFIARSGTGKTTLLEKVICGLTANGWTVGALKHDAHRFEIDHEGKDSWRMTKAGATVTAISSPEKTAIIQQHESEPDLDQLLAPFGGRVDIVLTEGFKSSPLPKIELHRSELGQPLLSREDDSALVAVCSDTVPNIDQPVFDLNKPAELVQFIEENFLA